MVSDELFFKLSGQVQGLELAIKTMIAIQFAAQVKDETGFAKAADDAQAISKHLSEHADRMLRASPRGAVESGVAALIVNEMRETATRCFDQSADSLDTIAQLVLRASEPPTDAKN